MRTSLNRIKRLDDYLFKKLNTQEMLLLDAELIINSDLKEELKWQNETYRIVKKYGQIQLKNQISEMFSKMENAPENSNLMKNILNLVKK